jgi:predicted metal-dependent hydrolase
MALDWSSGELAAGLACYRNEEFFEAHEHWEDVWRQLADPEKNFLQGLIQVTVAMHHFRNANIVGAEALLERALRRFEQCPESFAGINADQLRSDVLLWKHALGNDPSSFPASPRIIPMVGSRE